METNPGEIPRRCPGRGYLETKNPAFAGPCGLQNSCLDDLLGRSQSNRSSNTL